MKLTFYKIIGNVIFDDEDLGENMLLNWEPARMDVTDSLYWDFQRFWCYNLRSPRPNILKSKRRRRAAVHTGRRLQPFRVTAGTANHIRMSRANQGACGWSQLREPRFSFTMVPRLPPFLSLFYHYRNKINGKQQQQQQQNSQGAKTAP